MLNSHVIAKPPIFLSCKNTYRSGHERVTYLQRQYKSALSFFFFFALKKLARKISLFMPLPGPQTEYQAINSVASSKSNPISPCSDQTSRNSGKRGLLVDDRTSSQAHERVVLDPKRG
jgi:hypothetical protein